MLARKLIASSNPPELNYLTRVGVAANNAASFTFNNVDIGPAKAGRVLVLLAFAAQYFGETFTFSSISVEAEAAAQQVVSQATSTIIADITAEAWTLRTAQGGLVTISGILTGGVQNVDLVIYELLGAQNEVPYTSGAQIAVAPSVDLALTKTGSAVLVAAAKSNYSGSVTDIAFTGVVEDQQFPLTLGAAANPIAATGFLTDAPPSVAHTVTATFTGGGDTVGGHLLAAAWR